MNDLKNFLISDEAKLVYIIALLISTAYIVFYYFRKTKQQRLQRQNTIELKKIVKDVKKQSNKEKITSSSTLVVKNEPIAVKEEVKNVLTESNTTNIVVEKPIPVVNNITEINTKEDHKEKFLEQETIKTVIEPIPIKEEQPKTPFVNSKNKAAKMDDILNKLYQASIEKVMPKSQEKEDITYVNTVPDKKEAKKELEEITKKLEQQEENKNIELTEFEQMQEDTAIISLDELMKKAGEIYSYNEEIQYKDEGNEPISLKDLDNRKKNNIDIKNEEIDEVVTIDEFNITITPVEEEASLKETNEKFKPSSVISPVYGMKTQISRNTDLELENTANYEKLDEEIRKTNEFMATLKELQKKLD